MITFFGKMFPDANRVGVQFWDGHFPDGQQDPSVIQGYGPAGVGALPLAFENGFTIKYKWSVEVQKFGSGKENRIAWLDAPMESYTGSALLLGNDPRAMRTTLAKFAAIGSVFLIGLPHEELTITADHVASTISVPSIALCDWATTGQRVLLRRDDDYQTAVVQSAIDSTIVLDVDAGGAGDEGGKIMPLRPVYLEPQQDLPRYRVGAEIWNLQAHAAVPDFAPPLAHLELGPLTTSPAFDSVRILARDFGPIGNTRWFSLSPDGVSAGSLEELGGSVIFHFEPGASTLGEMASALEASTWVLMAGDYDPSDLIDAGDAFPFELLSGGTSAGNVGIGAALESYAGDGLARPVWDLELDNTATENDGVHALTRIIQHGALPYAIGTASRSDFYRYLKIENGDPADWQWFKLFMSTIGGGQKAFWLSTWRSDLTFLSRTLPGGGVTSIVISTGDGSDLFTWWPLQREHLQVIETNGTVTRAKITAAIDNLDGTATLTINDVIASAEVASLSWLELCRFERDEYDVKFGAKGFAIAMTARVVQR